VFFTLSFVIRSQDSEHSAGELPANTVDRLGGQDRKRSSHMHHQLKE
jgi:hypothetical protein